MKLNHRTLQTQAYPMRLRMFGEDPPDLERAVEQLWTVGIVQQDNQLLMSEDSFDDGLEPEDCSSMHRDGLA